jgi:hypothetical protein
MAIDRDAVVDEVDALPPLHDVEDHSLIGVGDADERIHVVDLGHPPLGGNDRPSRHDAIAVSTRDPVPGAAAGRPGEVQPADAVHDERDEDAQHGDRPGVGDGQRERQGCASSRSNR